MHWHIKSLNPNFKMPTRGTEHSVGYDLYAVESTRIRALDRALIPLGFAASFTEGYIAKYFDRSGMGNKGVTHFAGVIDPDYRGEWKVILYNSTHMDYIINPGDRIVQVIFSKVEFPEPIIVSALEESSRSGGLGSTGV